MLAFEANYGIMLETLEKLHEYLIENEFVLNVNKTELIFFGEGNIKKKLFIYREETNSAKELARSLGVLVDQNLTFAAEWNKCLNKMAVRIRSL